MTTSGNDFDIAKAVADQLKSIEKERQQRVLRWVAESLSLDFGIALTDDGPIRHTALRTAGATSSRADTHTQPQQVRLLDIKSFVDSKKPKSDVQFAAVVAYYYLFEAPVEARKDSIDADALREAARLAAFRRPTKPLQTLNNAKKLGYLDSTERGQFHINSVGENLVAMTLPGGQAEPARGKTRSSKPRKANPKKR